MKRLLLFAISYGWLCCAVPGQCASDTLQLIPMQGYVTDEVGTPVSTGNLAVFIHDAQTGGNLIWYSGTDYTGAVQDGVFDVVLGENTPLLLDGTRLYHMSVVVEGIQFISESTGGRYAFYSGGGSNDRPDLESRLDNLETVFAGGKDAVVPNTDRPLLPAFGGTGAGAQLDLGLLGTGSVSGEITGASVIGNLLMQPVGVYMASGMILGLGPFHIPRPNTETGVEEEDTPVMTLLRGCHPNPFNPMTEVRFDLAAPAAVWVEIHDLAGRLVRRILTGTDTPAGRHSVAWRGRDDQDRQVGAGVYLVRFRADDVEQTRVVTLLK